jgi:3-phytase
VSDIQWLADQQQLLITEEGNNKAWLYSPPSGLQGLALPVSDSDWEITSVSAAFSADQGFWYAVSDEGDRVLRFAGESLPAAHRITTHQMETAYIAAAVETDLVNSYGDAADDPEIWVNASDPAQSRILATDKQAGLIVYDLQGKQQQFIARGKVNNVDIRYGVQVGDKRVDLAMATNRSTGAVDIFTIDPVSGLVELLSANAVKTDFDDPYGGCLYQSPQTGAVHVFVNEKSGRYQQWQLLLEERRTRARLVRSFSLAGQPEGCVADDQQQRLYVGQEDYGVWVLDAEPDVSAALTLIDSVDSGRLVADIEGLSLYLGEDGKGYLVVSSQGDNSYALYNRDSHSFAGRFKVTANAFKGIDGSSETDGLAVTSANLGGEFEHGLLVVQDGRNLMPSQRQNFKLVAWRDIEAALQLEPVQAVSRR